MSRLIPLVRVPPVRDLHPDESTRGIFASTILSNGNYRIVYSRSKKEKINFHPIFVPKKTRRKSLNFSAYTSSILLKILSIIEDIKRNLVWTCVLLQILSKNLQLRDVSAHSLQNFLTLSHGIVFSTRARFHRVAFFKPSLLVERNQESCSFIFSLSLSFSSVQFRVITCWRARIHAESNASSRRSNWQRFPSGRGQKGRRGVDEELVFDVRGH